MTEMLKGKDFLGQEYGPGDWVLYSKGYGNSGSQMILAEVIEVKPTTVVAKVIQGSRSGKYNSWTHIDVRTGRRIGWSDKHIKKPAHYRHKETGEEITSSQLYERTPAFSGSPWNASSNPYVRNHSDYEYVPVTYWDYVVRGPYRDTLYIKDNIVKVDKEAFRESFEQRQGEDSN